MKKIKDNLENLDKLQSLRYKWMKITHLDWKKQGLYWIYNILHRIIK
jgi:hypothetical protein